MPDISIYLVKGIERVQKNIFYPKWFETSDNIHSQTISFHEQPLKHEWRPLSFVYTSIQVHSIIRFVGKSRIFEPFLVLN